MELLRAGVPTVLGWDGSVIDTEATLFARDFYADLANHQTPAHAAAKARRALLKAHLADPDRKTCRHWHMARLYAGAAGGGALTAARWRRPRPSHRGAAYNAFLDKERSRVPVAGPMAFVGRRREAQAILRVFGAREPQASRRAHPCDWRPGQIEPRRAHRRPDAPASHGGDFQGLRRPRHFRQAAERRAARRARAAARALGTAHRQGRHARRRAGEILTGPCAAYDPARERQPLLLIIDDLEQALEPPAPASNRHSGQAALSAPLGAVLGAFDRRAGGQSRLLLTSRYDFALTDRRASIWRGAARRALRPFDANEQGKQQRAARTELVDRRRLSTAPPRRLPDALLARARAAALGESADPGDADPRRAQPSPDRRRGRHRRDGSLLASGDRPDHGQGTAGDLFGLAFDRYRQALTAAGDASLPRRDAIRAAGAGGGVPGGGRRAWRRGKAQPRLYGSSALGLIDRFEAAPPADG